MNTDEVGSLDTLVQETLDADTEFQSGLEGKTDEEKADLVAAKTTEVREAKYTELVNSDSKNAELAENYKTRAVKAEEKNKGKGGEGEGAGEGEEKKEDVLSMNDLYSLMTSKVPKEDVEEVQKGAKILGVSIEEALKDDMVVGILAKRAEHRKTAEAANTDAGKPGASQKSDDQVLEDAKEGKLPEPGSPEAQQLYNARRGIKK